MSGDNGLMKHWTVDHCLLRSCGSTVRGRLNDHNNARNKYLYQTFSKTQNCNLNWMNILYLTNFLTSYFISLDCYTNICWLCALLAFNGQVFFRQGRAFFSSDNPLGLNLHCSPVKRKYPPKHSENFRFTTPWFWLVQIYLFLALKDCS